MSEEPGGLDLVAERLRSTIAELSETVKAANDVKAQLDDLVQRSKSNRNLITIVGFGAVLNFIVIIALTYMGIQLNTVIDTQHDSALCPLYSLFLEADTPANQERARAQGQDMQERERAFIVIRKSYDALRCGE